MNAPAEASVVVVYGSFLLLLVAGLAIASRDDEPSGMHSPHED